MRAGGAGKRAFDVAEQFGFEQLFGDRAAVDGDKRRAGARAGAVDGAREHFLAGTAFAADQHAGVRRGDDARLLDQLGHAAAAEDEPGTPGVVLPGLRRVAGRRELQRLFDLLTQDVAVEGLGQVAEDAARHCVDGIRNRPVRGEQDHRQRRPRGADFVEQGETVLARQADVTEHQLRRFDGDARQPFLGRGGGRHAVAPGVQAHGEQAQQILVVVDDEQVGRRFVSAHFAAPVGASLAAGGLGSERSMSARASIFRCSSSLRRWLSPSCCSSSLICAVNREFCDSSFCRSL